MPTVALPDRTIVSVAGPDAEPLLQNIITTDLGALASAEAKSGALLTPQGKILFDFLVSRDDADGFRLDVRRDVAEDFVRRLMLYRLRAKAKISLEDQTVVAAYWEDDSGRSQIDSTPSETGSARRRDTRFKDVAVYRLYGTTSIGAPPDAEWTLLRIAHGVAESGPDYELGDAFPHDVLLDQLDGVGFRKGCYVGQEVVSRMQHRGTARRRVLIVNGRGDLTSGVELRAGGKPVGMLGSVVGRDGLAIARLDKIKQAMDSDEPILAGDVEVALSIPTWATFGFPQEAAPEDA